jgi:hypothetical protein
VVQFPGYVFGFILFRSLAYCNGAWGEGGGRLVLGTEHLDVKER